MSLHVLAALLADLQIPGGCDDCDAYQTVTQHGQITLIEVHHDDTCPWLAAHQGKKPS